MTGKERDGVQKIRRKPGRVPTSCAECRRLKLRCDKQVPCEKCVSRGCGSICPDGSLTPGKGNRLVLTNTEELHDRIEQLSTRVRELENALRTLQDLMSDEPHPLLQKHVHQPIPPQNFVPPLAAAPLENTSVPTVSSQTEILPGDVRSQSTQAHDENFVDAFGTLAVGLRTECTFFGKTARSEYLLGASRHQQFQTKAIPPRLSKRLTELSQPELQDSDAVLGSEIFALLPTLSEAINLCEIYQEYGKFLYTPVFRAELFDVILASVYRVNSSEAPTSHHTLSLLLIIFAIAALFDTNRQPYSVEAQEFYHLSRAAMKLDPRTTRTSIQALIHIAQYLDFSDWDSMESNAAWMYVGHAVRLGHSAGLHLNSARWNLSEHHVQYRCRLFWQLFHLDTWVSFNTGRPPTMSVLYIDCHIPRDTGQPANNDREVPMDFHTWNWQYAALLHSIMAAAFGPKQPTYPVVLSLDRRVRDFPVPPVFRPVCDGTQQDAPFELHMQRWMILASKETTLLNLHRAYFAEALQEMPADMARHRYIPSVLATYRSAWRLIEGMQLSWKRVPQPLSRMSLPWSQVLSAAIVMCLLVTRAPSSSMAPSALTELDDVLKLFQDAAPTSRTAAHLLDSLQSLNSKAHDAMDHGAHRAVPDTELDRLGGKTHLLAEAGTTDDCTSGPSQSVTLTAVGNGSYTSDMNVDSMHPTLAQDMRSFDVGGPTFNDFNNLFDFPTTPSIPQQPPLPNVEVTDANFYPAAGFQPYHQHQPQPQPPFEQAAPILDATWQSFVEQLGF